MTITFVGRGCYNETLLFLLLITHENILLYYYCNYSLIKNAIASLEMVEYIKINLLSESRLSLILFFSNDVKFVNFFIVLTC